MYHYSQYPIIFYPYHNNTYYQQTYYRQPLNDVFWGNDVIAEQNYLTKEYDIYNQFGSLENDYLNPYGYTTREPQVPYLIPVDDIKTLKGKQIRTTVPNITGTITATVGSYNAQTNRVQLINIRSDRTGISYGNLSYLPEELSGLEVLSVPGSETDHHPPGSEDCTVTGGKGKYIDSGTAQVSGVPFKWAVYECQIEVANYVLNRTNTRVSFEMPGSVALTRFRYSIYVQNKTLWIEVESQYKNPLTGRWHKTHGAKTKVGSWASLKF